MKKNFFRFFKRSKLGAPLNTEAVRIEKIIDTINELFLVTIDGTY